VLSNNNIKGINNNFDVDVDVNADVDAEMLMLSDNFDVFTQNY